MFSIILQKIAQFSLKMNLFRTVTRIVFQTYGLLFSEIKKIVLTLC